MLIGQLIVVYCMAVATIRVVIKKFAVMLSMGSAAASTHCHISIQIGLTKEM